MAKIQIAAILTVFNRKKKTLSCLRHLFDAMEAYNQQDTEKAKVAITIYMTDDGCTDGTTDAVKDAFPLHDIHIIQGTGSLFWAGGMRLAWQTAIDSGTAWEYFLLLNDDTNVWSNLFDELFGADTYGFNKTGRHGLSSGITCQPNQTEKITYGGFIFESNAKGVHVLAQPAGGPQAVDMTHANILLIHHQVVDDCGIFYKGYIHGVADEDYCMMAKRKKFPTMVTAHVCGECPNDHYSQEQEANMLMGLSLAERRKYVNNPTHSDSDYLLFVRRNLPLRFPVAWLMRQIRLYWPKIYYQITLFRGVYKE